jgi:CO/xanthine dehydrogenase Mo-binding subunit
LEAIGKSVPKKESFDKVTGTALYTGDHLDTRMLYARMAISPFANALILGIDTSAAWQVQGIRAILTGECSDVLTGEEIRDRPIIAKDRVRFFGETVAVVVADTEVQAKRAADLIRVRYEPLLVSTLPWKLCGRTLRSFTKGWVSIQRHRGWFPFPAPISPALLKSAKETSTRGGGKAKSIAEIRPDGYIHIESSTQAPFAVKKYMGLYFGFDPGRIVVKTPLVGGAYGGKAAIQLELVAYLASQAVGGG